ncbi:MAG TPA: DUF2806 domain-containing protein [Candidatus Paceibacterota bacterium]|nr:DUF2806 domain-containing protein [Candidatus Paceibacterota bacterium]
MNSSMDPATALTTALDNSTKVANTPLFATVIDRMLGFKISEWAAQGDAIKRQILDGYEDAKQKGLGIQYVSAFRANANLLNTGVKASKYIDATTQQDIKIDNDVFWGLIEHSKEISNEDVQELIAKIIAGEYNVPGTYSMSTLQVLKMLGKPELELFERMCGFLLDKSRIPQELFHLGDDVKDFMSALNLDFGSLQTLQSLSLILPNEMTQTIPNPDKKNYHSSYFDKALVFTPIDDNYKEIKLPDHYGLSAVGAQILRHLSPKFNNAFYEWLKKHYSVPHYKLIE